MTEHTQHGNMWLSAATAAISIVHYVMAVENRSTAAATIACISGIVAIVAGIMTIREKYLSIKKLKG